MDENGRSVSWIWDFEDDCNATGVVMTTYVAIRKWHRYRREPRTLPLIETYAKSSWGLVKSR